MRWRRSGITTGWTRPCAGGLATAPARSRSCPTTSRLSGNSPARVLRVRRRPRHALDLLLRDGPQVVLVRYVRRGVRVPRPDTGEEEVLAGPMQVVPAGHLARQLAFALVHDEVRSEERRVGKECRSRWSP